MADRPNSRSPARPPASPSNYQPRQRETADERRVRQTETALAKQVDLKREAAERRDRKSDSDSK